MKKSTLDAARGLIQRLRDEGRHRDAQIILDVVRSAESSRNLNAELHADNMKLRASRKRRPLNVCPG